MAMTMEFNEVVQDGMHPEPVLMVGGALPGLVACDPGHHCCAHTGGPQFPCCRCGAKFERVDTMEAVEQ